MTARNPHHTKAPRYWQDQIQHPSIEPEILLPVQFEELTKGQRTLTPEQKLWMEVLEGGIRDALYRPTTNGGDRHTSRTVARLATEARDWINTPGETPCSFEFACAVVGFNAEQIRKGLQRASAPMPLVAASRDTYALRLPYTYRIFQYHRGAIVHYRGWIKPRGTDLEFSVTGSLTRSACRHALHDLYDKWEKNNRS